MTEFSHNPEMPINNEIDSAQLFVAEKIAAAAEEGGETAVQLYFESTLAGHEDDTTSAERQVVVEYLAFQQREVVLDRMIQGGRNFITVVTEANTAHQGKITESSKVFSRGAAALQEGSRQVATSARLGDVRRVKGMQANLVDQVKGVQRPVEAFSYVMNQWGRDVAATGETYERSNNQEKAHLKALGDAIKLSKQEDEKGTVSKDFSGLVDTDVLHKTAGLFKEAISSSPNSARDVAVDLLDKTWDSTKLQTIRKLDDVVHTIRSGAKIGPNRISGSAVDAQRKIIRAVSGANDALYGVRDPRQLEEWSNQQLRVLRPALEEIASVGRMSGKLIHDVNQQIISVQPLFSNPR